MVYGAVYLYQVQVSLRHKEMIVPGMTQYLLPKENQSKGNLHATP